MLARAFRHPPGKMPGVPTGGTHCATLVARRTLTSAVPLFVLNPPHAQSFQPDARHTDHNGKPRRKFFSSCAINVHRLTPHAPLTKMPTKTLVVAEKPSVAQDLARVLGIKPGRGEDFFENDKYVISSAVGHLLEIAPPEGSEVPRGKWNLENLPSLPAYFDLHPIEKNANRLAVLKRLIKRKDVGEIINACDAGREGELIFRNIIRATGAKQPLKRLWLQSMTPDSIRAAFQHLRSDADMLPLADAAMSRSEADWLVGINSTRAFTSFNSRGGGFQKTTAGRVQTPTLAILAEREEKIRAFQERTTIEVIGTFEVKAGSYDGRWFDEQFKKEENEVLRTNRLLARLGLNLPNAEARLQPEFGSLWEEYRFAYRLWHREIGDAIAAKCAGKPGIIAEEKKAASQISPQLYDLTTLQREANSRFGFPARMTLQIAQALYEKHKALTYPRTDSRYLPEDHLATAKQVMGSFSGELAKHANKAMQSGWVKPNKRIFNNAKVSDHFAIVPTGTVPSGLDDKEQRIFDLVARPSRRRAASLSIRAGWRFMAGKPKARTVRRPSCL